MGADQSVQTAVECDHLGQKWWLIFPVWWGMIGVSRCACPCLVSGYLFVVCEWVEKMLSQLIQKRLCSDSVQTAIFKAFCSDFSVPYILIYSTYSWSPVAFGKTVWSAKCRPLLEINGIKHFRHRITSLFIVQHTYQGTLQHVNNENLQMTFSSSTLNLQTSIVSNPCSCPDLWDPAQCQISTSSRSVKDLTYDKGFNLTPYYGKHQHIASGVCQAKPWVYLRGGQH